jgi:hypothetical protein
MSAPRWHRFVGAMATIAVLSVTLIIGSAEVGSAERAGQIFPKAVEMKVDYTAKTITITAHIDFYQTTGTLPEADIVSNIVKAVTAAWNGHKFKCFAVVVKVDAKIVASKSAVRPDAVDIKLDNSRLNAFSHVLATSTPNTVSDAFGDRIDPYRETGPETTPPTTWGKYTDSAVWPHEFGHILGLHDGYDPANNANALPGAQMDLMFSQGYPITAELITRVVRRNNDHGQLDESKVKCALSMDAGPASINAFLIEVHGLGVHAHTCDYDPPSDDPTRQPLPITWNGKGYGSGVRRLPGLVTYAGSYEGPIAFTSQADVPYSFDLVSPTGTIQFGGTYTWDSHGVPISVGSMTLFHFESSAIGLGLYPVFTEGAAECPP